MPKATQPSGREAEGAAGSVARWLQPAAGMRLTRSLPSAPSASTRDPFQDFNGLLTIFARDRFPLSQLPNLG
jgi:hypothetical protein